jgi:hypothetical protein
LNNTSRSSANSINALNRHNQAIQRNTRSMGRGQVAIQQTGYQLGDFIVQVQSGTNAYVAAGQQLTQMAGLLTLMGGSMVAIGASLSVIIPLVTAFGAAWSRTRQEAENAGDSILSNLSSLEGSYGDVQDAQERLTDAISLMGAIQSDTSRAVIQNLREELSAREELLAVERVRMEIQREQLRAGIEARQREIEALFAEVESSQNMFPGSFVDPGLQSQRDRIQEIIEANRQLFLEQREANAQLELTNAILEQIDNGYEEVIESARETATANRDIYDSLQASAQEAQASQLEMASSMYQAFAEADAAAQTFMQTLITNLGYAFDEAVKTNQALQEIGSLDTSSTVSAIMAIANALGVATAEAIALANSLPGYTGGGVNGPDGAQYGPSETGGVFGTISPEGFVRDVRTGNLARTGYTPEVGSGGGGGGGGGGFTSMFPELAAQVEQANQALQAFRSEQEILNSALENGMITQQQFNQMLQQAQEAYGVADSAAAQYESTVDSP